MSASSVTVLDLSHRDDLLGLAELLTDVRSAAPSAELLIVGALARDLLLHYGHGIAIERATEDVDLGLAVADWRQFEAIREALIVGGRFASDRKVIHKLRHHKGTWIDLIPFGAVERPDGTIAWPPSGDDVMAVFAYSEANAAAVLVTVPLSLSVRVVSLPMLAGLKVLVWKDRHVIAPRKDAKDLMLILDSYLNAGNNDRLYVELKDLLTDDFDFEKTGAWLVGRDLRALIHKHSTRADALLGRLLDVLGAELDLHGRLTLIAQMSDSNPNRAQRLLGAFQSGLRGGEVP